MFSWLGSTYPLYRTLSGQQCPDKDESGIAKVRYLVQVASGQPACPGSLALGRQWKNAATASPAVCGLLSESARSKKGQAPPCCVLRAPFCTCSAVAESPRPPRPRPQDSQGAAGVTV